MSVCPMSSVDFKNQQCYRVVSKGPDQCNMVASLMMLHYPDNTIEKPGLALLRCTVSSQLHWVSKGICAMIAVNCLIIPND